MAESSYTIAELMKIPVGERRVEYDVLIYDTGDRSMGPDTTLVTATEDERGRLEIALDALKEAGEISGYEIIERGSEKTGYRDMATALLQIAYDGMGSGSPGDDLLEEMQETLGVTLMLKVECPHCEEEIERAALPSATAYECPECGKEISI